MGSTRSCMSHFTTVGSTTSCISPHDTTMRELLQVACHTAPLYEIYYKLIHAYLLSPRQGTEAVHLQEGCGGNTPQL